MAVPSSNLLNAVKVPERSEQGFTREVRAMAGYKGSSYSECSPKGGCDCHTNMPLGAVIHL